MGQNYLRSLIALGFQAFLIIVCVAIYAVLVQEYCHRIRHHYGHLELRGLYGPVVLTLFKTGSLAKSVFNAH